MIVGLVSAKGGPGTTTATLALASRWPRPVFVLEADPFGGDIRAGLGEGEWPAAAGLADLVVDLRTVSLEQALDRRIHQPGPHAPAVLAGFGCVGQAASVPWTRLADDMARLPGLDVVADCGRMALADGVLPLLRACDVLVLVSGSSLRAVRAAARITPLLQTELGVRVDDPQVSLLVIGADRPYPAEEIAVGCRLPLLGVLPHDTRAAAVWSDGARPWRGFARSSLQRQAEVVARTLAGMGAGAWGAA